MQNWAEVKEVLLEGLSGSKRDITSRLLENERNYLSETAAAGVSATGNFARFDKVVLPLIRRVMPATVATEFVGVQPMAQPLGVAFSQRIRYADTVATGGPTANEEASGVKVYDKYSKIVAGEAYTASDSRTAAQLTAALESAQANRLNVEVVKQTIEAGTRKLQAQWTMEAQADSKALHGIDLEQTMTASLADEIIRDLDREVITELTNLAGTVKAFDFALADGRFAGEKYTALTVGASDLSNQIAIKTKRAGATWMLVSPNVLVALRHANNGSFIPAFDSDLNVSATLFAGTFNGSIRVFVDVYATSDTILMGFKGNTEVDAGLIYAPYIPVTASSVVTDPTTMDSKIMLYTRYALAKFTDTSTSLGNSANFYSRATITNLSLGF